MGKHKYYGVRRGKDGYKGIFDSWEECIPFVLGVRGGADFKGFTTREAALQYTKTGEVENPKKYYGVAKGWTPGVYPSWGKAQDQIKGYPHAQHRSHGTKREAIDYVAEQRGIEPDEVFVAQSYFDRFRGSEASRKGIKFEPVDDQPFIDQFHLLASSQNWKPGSQDYRTGWNRAIKEELDFHYLTPLRAITKERREGIDIEELENRKMDCYRTLCKVLGKERPNSIEEAKEILQARPWVNIDLIDFRRTGIPPLTWDDFEEFRDYTSMSKKWIDLEFAKSDEFLEALLVNFAHPERNHFDYRGKRSEPIRTNSRVRDGRVSKRAQPAKTRSARNQLHIEEAFTRC